MPFKEAVKSQERGKKPCSILENVWGGTKAMLDDEYETPTELYKELCNTYGIYPETDVCATDETSKCVGYIDKEMDCLRHDFKYSDYPLWCNPPHSLTKQFVKKMHDVWNELNYEIMMIIPANSICTKYAEKYIKDKAEIHPIYGRPRFLKDGKPSKHGSRNSYFVVIWRKWEEKE